MQHKLEKNIELALEVSSLIRGSLAAPDGVSQHLAAMAADRADQLLEKLEAMTNAAREIDRTECGECRVTRLDRASRPAANELKNVG